MSDKVHTFSFIYFPNDRTKINGTNLFIHTYITTKLSPPSSCFPACAFYFRKRNISLLYLKEKIVLSNKKAPTGDSGYLCMSYCGKHFISTRKWDNKEQYTGGFTLSFHTDTALPHQWNSFKKRIPVFLYMEKPILSIRHPAGNPPGLHQLKKLFQFFLGTFIIVILKSLSPDYHTCLPAVFSIQTNKVLGAPTQRAAV